MAFALQKEGSGRARPTPFEELFAAEWPKVVRVAQRVLWDRARAEETAQDVFLSFYRRFGDTLPERPGPWLYAAAAHTALNALRAESRRLMREQQDAVARADTAPDPLGEIERAEAMRELSQALGRLKPGSAAILALRYSGLSYQEIAQTLEVPVSQVGTRLRRAETALRKEMQRATRG